MIERLTKQDDEEYPYIDPEGISYRSKTDYLCHYLGFCGCGNNEIAMSLVGDVLRLLSKPDRDYREIESFIPNEAMLLFILYYLDAKYLTEHGSSVYGSWLTPFGHEVLSDIEWCIKNEVDE